MYFALVDLLNVTVECGLPKSDAAVQDGLRPLFPGMIKWMSVNNSRVQEKTLRAFVDFAQNERIGVKFIAPMALPAYRSEVRGWGWTQGRGGLGVPGGGVAG